MITCLEGARRHDEVTGGSAQATLRCVDTSRECRGRVASGRIEQVLTGRASQHPADGTGSPVDGPWFTAIHKSAVEGRIAVGPEGLAGDEHADPLRHGGRDKAVLLFAIDHYPAIASRWQLELVPGAFGENLLVSDVDERRVCIGDLWRIGTALLRVTQPRQPAWKIARRWHRTRLPKALAANGATGWYASVDTAGEIWRGAPIGLVARPLPQWPVRRAVEVLYAQGTTRAEADELAAVPLLAACWKQKIAARFRASRRRA